MVFELDTQSTKLRLQVANTNTKDETPDGEHVEASQLLGQDQRIALREDDHPRTQANRRSNGSCKRQCNHRIEDGLCRFHRRRCHTRIRQHYVLTGPQRFEAGGFGLLRDAHQHRRVETSTLIDIEQTKLHRWHAVH